MEPNGDSHDDEGQGVVPEPGHESLLQGGPEGVPASHGGVEGSRGSLVSVLESAKTNINLL